MLNGRFINPARFLDASKSNISLSPSDLFGAPLHALGKNEDGSHSAATLFASSVSEDAMRARVGLEPKIDDQTEQEQEPLLKGIQKRYPGMTGAAGRGLQIGARPL